MKTINVLAIFALIVTLGVPCSLSAVHFDQVSTRVYDIRTGDPDNDGIMELVEAHSSSNQVVLYVPRDSEPGYRLKNAISFPENVNSVAVFDVDQDGRDELIVGTSNADDGGYLYVGEISDRAFIEEWKSPLLSSIREGSEIAVGDADNDGFLEIAVGVTWYGRYLVIYEFNGSGFTEIHRFTIGSDVASVAYGDVDNDGVDELVVGTECWSDYGLRIYDNYTLVFSDTGNGRTEVALGDVDGDGQLEIITGVGTRCGTGATTPEPYFAVYKWTGTTYNLLWQSPPLVTGGRDAYVEVDAGQLLRGGAKEIIIGTWGKDMDSVLSLWWWTGNGFQQIGEKSFLAGQGCKIQSVYMLDCDQDGMNEIAVGTDCGGSTIIRFD